jgi:hypothetical protein
MTRVHAQIIGDQAVLPRADLERLVELARKSEPVEVETSDEEFSTRDLMRLADSGGSFDFWKSDEEDIYTEADGDPL